MKCDNPGCTNEVKRVAKSKYHHCSRACKYANPNVMKDVGKGMPTRVPSLQKLCRSCSNIFQSVALNQVYCKICVPDRKAKWRMDKFGMSDPAYRQLLLEQNNQCGICGRSFEGLKRGQITSPDVDHNHRTGAVRGLLCHWCNQTLSGLETPGWLEKAQEWLKRGA